MKNGNSGGTPAPSLAAVSSDAGGRVVGCDRVSAVPADCGPSLAGAPKPERIEAARPNTSFSYRAARRLVCRILATGVMVMATAACPRNGGVDDDPEPVARAFRAQRLSASDALLMYIESRMGEQSEKPEDEKPTGASAGMLETPPEVPPKIRDALFRPLEIDGREVRVRITDSVNGKIGRATCDGRDPVIHLAAEPRKKLRINPYAFLFFREHEFAHVANEHVDCDAGRGHPKEDWSKKQEFEADCAAARLLISFTDGQRIFDRAWAILNGIPSGPSPTHALPKERADRLDSVCLAPEAKTETEPQATSSNDASVAIERRRSERPLASISASP
jgi:hypothetical protein